LGHPDVIHHGFGDASSTINDQLTPNFEIHLTFHFFPINLDSKMPELLIKSAATSTRE